MSDERATHVLTVRQPWAWAIIHAGKNVENRTWKPRQPIRILIHAGVRLEERGLARLRELGIEPPPAFIGGHIIGAVDYAGLQPPGFSPWAIDGYYHWRLENPRPARPPIPARGRSALWPPPENWRDSFRGLA